MKYKIVIVLHPNTNLGVQGLQDSNTCTLCKTEDIISSHNYFVSIK